MTAQHSTNCSSFSVKKQTNCIVIILDFLTDRGENAACQDQEVSEWGGDNTLIATPGARSKAAVITSQNTNPCLLHYL